MNVIEYAVEQRDTDGDVVRMFNDFLSLSYTLKRNDVGLIAVSVLPNHPILGDVQLGDPLFIARQISGTYETAGMYRGVTYQTDADGVETATLFAVGFESVFRNQIVAYRSDDGNNSDHLGIASSLIFERVMENNTVFGSDSGRVTPIPDQGVQTITLSSSGDNVYYQSAWKNVLTVMQDMANLGRADFIADNLYAYPDIDLDVNYTHDTWPTDRRKYAIFSPGRGNMAQASRDGTKLYEPTKAIVGGRGDRGSRTVQVVFGDNYDSTRNLAEIFVDDSGGSSSSNAADRGVVELEKLKKLSAVDFDFIGTAGMIYGFSFVLNTVVTVEYAGVSETKKVSEVGVTIDSLGNESITIELIDWFYPGVIELDTLNVDAAAVAAAVT
jgi:hypothetical protein